MQVPTCRVSLKCATYCLQSENVFSNASGLRSTGSVFESTLCLKEVLSKTYGDTFELMKQELTKTGHATIHHWCKACRNLC
jgi:hypothetical protein